MGANSSVAGTILFPTKGYDFCHPGFKRHSKYWNPNDMEVDLSGKTVAITGSDSGLGYAAADAIARKKAYVILICRTPDKANKAVQSLKENTGNENIEFMQLDVSSPAAVKEFANNFLDSGRDLHALINNAGLLSNEKKFTKDNLELTFATNTLGTFLLTEYLMPVLSRCNGRVVVVSSGGMYTQKMDAKDFQGEHRSYDGPGQYSQTKRQQIYLTELWAEKYKDTGVSFYSMHPGWARTPGTISSLPGWFDKLPLRTPEEGADTMVWLSIREKAAEEENGKFFFDRSVVSPDLPLAHTHGSKEDKEALYAYCSKFKE